MKQAYQVIERNDSRALAEFLSQDGQLLLPLLELIEKAELAVDELAGVFMTLGGPIAAPQRLGTTSQSSWRWGRMPTLRPTTVAIAIIAAIAGKSGGHCTRSVISCIHVRRDDGSKSKSKGMTGGSSSGSGCGSGHSSADASGSFGIWYSNAIVKWTRRQRSCGHCCQEGTRMD